MSGKTGQLHGRDHDPRGHDPLQVRLHIKVNDDTTTLSTGDGKIVIAMEDDCDSLYLLAANAYVSTVSSSGTPTIQITNVTRSVDLLSTKLTIDASEFTSYTAAAPAVVSGGTAAKVAVGDRLSIDCDVAGTGAKGLGLHLRFGKPAS